MTINKIREKIASELCDASCFNDWCSVFDNTTPEHNGIESIEVSVIKDNIWVDVSLKEYSFKNLEVHATLQLKSLNDCDGVQKAFDFVFTGGGTFNYSTGKSILIDNLSINEQIELSN